MLKIGEFSKLTNISVRMLHHCDEIGLLKPIKIAQNGYRLYSVHRFRHKIVMFRDLHFNFRNSKCSS
ncbi:MAG: MerR family DNA-binding transcriptional regulator [Longibaculum sp.]